MTKYALVSLLYRIFLNNCISTTVYPVLIPYFPIKAMALERNTGLIGAKFDLVMNLTSLSK